MNNSPGEKRVTMFAGKGGVGKTTCAGATALHHASNSGDTLVISTDPTPSLSHIFEMTDKVKPARVLAGLYLAELGQRIMLVDMDPQSHCAVGLAVPEEQIEQSIYDVLISASRNEPIKLTEILWQINDRLELAPASIDLSAFEQQMAGVAERECCLKNALSILRSFYQSSEDPQQLQPEALSRSPLA